MSVDGVPSVDDVERIIDRYDYEPHGTGVRPAAEAVHALYAPHLRARAEYRVLALSSGSYEPCIVSHVGADIFESRSTAEKLAADVREKGWADRVWVEERRAREAGDWAEPKEQD